jgi:hypothetical protein
MGVGITDERGIRARSRRLCAAAATLAAAFSPALPGPPPAAAQEAAPLRVYVVVLDGLRPHEVDPTLMPNFTQLQAGGTWYDQARSVFIAETLPNHAAMMTGVLPQRSGIVANDYWGPELGTAQRVKMMDPSLLGADTLTTRLENSCGAISTATVQSKEYLWGLFRGEPETPGDPNPQREADFHWDPQSSDLYIGSPDDHAPDIATMNEGVLPWLRSAPTTPQFAFINLGDIDRSGHIDESGALTQGNLSGARRAAMRDTDQQLGEFLAELQAQDAWEETVLIFASDHGFDWSQPQSVMFMSTVLSENGYSVEDLETHPITNGGAGMLYVKDEADIAPLARVYDSQPAVEFVATREPVPGLDNPTHAEMGIDHRNAGDIVIFLKPGWRMGDENNFAIPGNHGHPFTQRSTMLVTGGHPIVRDGGRAVTGELVYDPSVKPFSAPGGGPGNLSIAPTVAALFGIGQPSGGYDGPPLSEAFEDYAFAPHGGCRAATPSDVGYPRPRGAGPLQVSMVPAFEQCTEGDLRHGPPLAFASCSAPQQISRRVTVGTPDANERAAASVGSVRLGVRAGDPSTATDEADVTVTASVTDVREQSDLSDYAGELLLTHSVRLTDRGNGPSETESATVQDVDLAVDVPCSVTGDGAKGADCSVSTTFDAVVPGVVTEGRRAIWQLGDIRLFDGGADGDAATAPNALFARQGIFVP